MRLIAATLIAAAVGAGALAASSLGSDRGRMSTHRRSSLKLPGPITIAGGRMRGQTSYQIARDGRVSRVAAIRSPFPHDAAWFPGSGVWFSDRRGHLVVGRYRRQLWRSQREFSQSHQNIWLRIGGITVGPHAVAFSYDRDLFLAPLGGSERMVARGESPLAWTVEGLLTYRGRGNELLLRRADGTLVMTIWRGARGYGYDTATGTIYWLAHGFVMAARGTKVRRLASLRTLGLSPNPSSVALQSLGRLVELQDNTRLVFLHSDGSVFAATPLPRSSGISGGPVVSERTSAVAFATTPDQAPGGFGLERVYVLRAGAHGAIPIHSASVNLTTCARGANLQWHGNWLLYTNSEHDIAALDTTGKHRAIELNRLVKTLPGTHGGFNAFWSGQPDMW